MAISEKHEKNHKNLFCRLYPICWRDISAAYSTPSTLLLALSIPPCLETIGQKPDVVTVQTDTLGMFWTRGCKCFISSLWWVKKNPANKVLFWMCQWELVWVNSSHFSFFKMRKFDMISMNFYQSPTWVRFCKLQKYTHDPLIPPTFYGFTDEIRQIWNST